MNRIAKSIKSGAIIAAFVLIIANFGFGQIPNVSSGKIIRHENFQSKYVQARNIDVWLPEGYDVRKKYAVLYMHDGQMLFDSTSNWNKQEWGVDETLGRLIGEKKVEDCIVVGIWNNPVLRHPEYFPEKPFDNLSETNKQKILNLAKENNIPLEATGPISDNYLKFIVMELKPIIDSNYSTHKNSRNTYIAGSSMGGLISLYAICEYPDIFGAAACLSTHWPGVFSTKDNPVPSAFMQYLDKNLPSPENHKIYFDYGTETLDAVYKPYQLQADSIMKIKGYTPKNWITKEFTGEDHTEKAWRKRFDVPVTFLLGKESKAGKN